MQFTNPEHDAAMATGHIVRKPSFLRESISSDLDRWIPDPFPAGLFQGRFSPAVRLDFDLDDIMSREREAFKASPQATHT